MANRREPTYCYEDRTNVSERDRKLEQIFIYFMSSLATQSQVIIEVRLKRYGVGGELMISSPTLPICVTNCREYRIKNPHFIATSCIFRTRCTRLLRKVLTPSRLAVGTLIIEYCKASVVGVHGFVV